jgi:hypothetical protein
MEEKLIDEICNRIRNRDLFLNKQYSYVNGCKIKDVIELFKTLIQLYTYMMSGNSKMDISVNDILDHFNIKSGPMILISDNRWYDLRKAYFFGLQTNIDGLNQALRDGFVFIYELDNCRVKEGL